MVVAATAVAEATPTTEVESSMAVTAGMLVAASVTAAVTVTVMVPSVHGGVEERALLSEVTDAILPGVEMVPVGAVDAAAPSKVKDWFASVVSQLETSTTFPLTVKHVPAWFSGEMDRGPAEPLNGNSWELVTAPPVSVSFHAVRPNQLGIPPSARPPQLNIIAWSPAARRGSKFMQA